MINIKKIYHGLQTLFKYLPWLPQTIYFNFHYLPFGQAIKLPIILRKPRFVRLKGKVSIENDNVRFGMIVLGKFVNISLIALSIIFVLLFLKIIVTEISFHKMEQYLTLMVILLSKEKPFSRIIPQ